MKKYLYILTFLGLSNVAFAQISAISFTYDAAGNRIQRKVITLPGKKADEPIQQIRDSVGIYVFNFYPNPTSGQLTVEVASNFMVEENKKAYLFDMEGKLLQQRDVASTSMPFDLNAYTPGIYIFRIESKGYASEWKVVKE